MRRFLQKKLEAFGRGLPPRPEGAPEPKYINEFYQPAPSAAAHTQGGEKAAEE